MRMEKRKNKRQKSAWKRVVSCMLALLLTVGGLSMSLVPVHAATVDDEGMFGVTIDNDNSGNDTSNLCVADLFASESIDGNFATTPYWKQDPANAGKLVPGSESDYSLYYDSTNTELHLKDLNLVVNSTADGNAIFSNIDLKLVLEGTNNQITCNGGIAVMTEGNLEIAGSGNLEVTTTVAADSPAFNSPAFLVGANIIHNGTGTVTLHSSGDADGICWIEGEDMPTTHEITGNGDWAGSPLPEEPGPLPDPGAGRGIVIDDAGMHSEETGDSLYYLNGDDGTIKADGAGESTYNIKYEPGDDKNILYLKNLTLEASGCPEGLVYESEKELEIQLEGTNSITSDEIAMRLGRWDNPDESIELLKVSKVTFKGNGSLKLKSGITGMVVISDVFENHATIDVVVNESAELGAEITANAEEGKVRNTGSVTVSNKKIVVGGIGEAEGLSYSADIKGHEMPQTDAVIEEGAIGKCYYFYAEEYYPNEHIADVKDAPRIYGKYNEEGDPIPSNIVIQTVTYDKYNVPVMDDWGEPTWWLVYEDDYNGDIDNIVKDIDIVSVCDGEKHTFNTNIYRAWIEDGDVTIRGDVTCDIALFEAPILSGPLDYDRDDNNNILFWRDSKNTKITIQGNVGFMSLNQSFDGNVTVDGKIDAIGLYDDVNVADGAEPEETAVYGPYATGTNIVSAGQLSSKSNLIGGTAFTDGDLKGYGVYGGDLYVMTAGKEGSQEVKGTCNVLEGNPAVVSVSADSVTSGSAPKVEDAEATDKAKVESVIGADKTYTAFDLELIEDNAKAVQPVKEMDVFISNTEGYKNPVVCYVKPDGTLEQHNTQISNGKICFQTNHLSTYVVVESDDLKKAGVTTTEKYYPAVDVSYKTHVQSFGWQSYVKNGAMSGTSGKAKRLEGIRIQVASAEAGKTADLGIQYTTHCQSYGWLPWSSNDDMNGTEGEAKRLEAIMIKLTGADKDQYDVYYRVHAQSYGWLGWAKNGEPSGTAGYAKRLEGIQIVVVKKGALAPGISYAGINGTNVKYPKAYYAKAGSSPIVNYPATSNTNPVVPGDDMITVAYRTHVQSIGWQGWKFNGQMSGTSGMAKRLEGIEIKLNNKAYSGDIVYTTHVQSYGWQGNENSPSTWKKNGEMSGTSGKAKRLEAIRIGLTGEMAQHYDIYYRVHAQSYGWLGWAKNGEASGTAGYAKRLEGIQIVLVPKGGSAPAVNYGGITSVHSQAYVKK